MTDFEGAPVSIMECRILVVEDSVPIRRVIGAYLKSAGLLNVEFAEDGVIGLEKVSLYNPDLVILDIRMPNLDGYGFLKKLRNDPDRADLPVLVQTAYSDPEERNKAFIEGGTDLITKPINGVELLARVNIHLENRMLLRSLKAYRNRLEDELNAARKMQEAMLPSPSLIADIEQNIGIEIKSFFEPSSELGGDFWGLQFIDDERMGVFIVDFSGHGVNSALNTFRLHTLMDSTDMPVDNPAAYMTVLNKKLHALIPRGQFATMFYGVIDSKNNTLTYSAAASTSPVIGSKGTDKFVFHDASGLPLGITEKAIYSNNQIAFNRGSYLFLYSDALIETAGTEHDMLDEDGLADLITAGLTSATEKHTFSHILDTFNAGVSRPLPDDLTVLWLERP